MIACTPLRVRKAAVLGAGVMGAQIAAHLVNADVETMLFDLPARTATRTASSPRRSRTSPSSRRARSAEKIRAAAIIAGELRREPRMAPRLRSGHRGDRRAARLEARPLRKIAPYLSENAVLASNTSGLSINALAEALLDEASAPSLQRHPLLQPAALHAPRRADPGSRRPIRAILDGLEAFLTTTLGKGVVCAKDTPNFIGNRIGVFSILATMHHTRRSGSASTSSTR